MPAFTFVTRCTSHPTWKINADSPRDAINKWGEKVVKGYTPPDSEEVEEDYMTAVYQDGEDITETMRELGMEIEEPPHELIREHKRSYIDLSTAHITLLDSHRLAAGVLGDPLIHDPHEYGWWVAAPNFTTEGREEAKRELLTFGYSAALVGILLKAHELGITWIKFDQDGDRAECFPTFEW